MSELREGRKVGTIFFASATDDPFEVNGRIVLEGGEMGMVAWVRYEYGGRVCLANTKYIETIVFAPEEEPDDQKS